MALLTHQRIGDLLVNNGTITPQQLHDALAKKKHNQKIGHVLIELGFISEQDLVDVVSKQAGIPALDSDMFLIDPAVIELLTEDQARRFMAVPLFLVDQDLTVAMADPLDITALDELSNITTFRVSPVVVAESALQKAINEYYAVNKSLTYAMSEMDETTRNEDGGHSAVRIVNQIIYKAVKLGASDIHIEPQEDRCRVRFRIDGVLHEILKPEKQVFDPMVSRLKILANLDISEKRLPQDGRFSLTIGERIIDIRFSTLPTTFGEKVVLRILDKSSASIGLNAIGLDEEDYNAIIELLTNPHGLLLVTGPTGSGKTTTLYSMLKHVSTPEKNIITVEDPIEYRFQDINQVQVNNKVQLTFSRGLRSILRQDPDIIMIGEIRDEETASIAVRSALTGHLVLSTLHTNDAVSTVGRLIDMGIKPYLLVSSLLGVIAQRLIRTVCVECVRQSEPTPEIIAEFNLQDEDVSTIPVIRGCPRCNHTGYRGRIAVFEILTMNDTLRSIVLESNSSIALKQMVEQQGLSTVRASAVRKLITGKTTPDEIRRVIASAGL